MKEDLEKSVKKGEFSFPDGRKFQGELKLAGMGSSLSLEVPDWRPSSGIFLGFFPDSSQDAESIKGILGDSKKVSLLHCTTAGFSFHPAGKEFTYEIRFFPRFAVFGDQHVSPDEKKITGVSFTVDDADILFYDPGLFGAVTEIDKETKLRRFVEQIAQYNDYGPEVEIAEHPQVFYYSGKTEIFKAETKLGTVSALNKIEGTFGNSKGFKVENTVFVNLEFAEALNIGDAVKKTLKVLRFLELLAGRPQNLLKLLVRKETGQAKPEELEVYGSSFPRYDRPENKQISHKLISPVRNPEEFSRVLANWLERHDSRLYARSKFLYSFGKPVYDADRLISAAGMFDVLPKEDSPRKPELDQEIMTAVEKSKGIWENALKDVEGNNESEKQCKDILGTLGRLEKSVTLREKICHRAENVIEKIGDKVPELDWIIGKAVICRNHYTHRDELETIRKCDKVRNFLTDTLEFVFAVSELIEAGWDIESWNYNRSTHPFGRYLGNYKSYLGNYREDLKKLKN